MPDPRISRTFIGQSPIARNLPARITPSFHNVNSFVMPCRWAIRFCMRNVCWKRSVSASVKSCASARDLKLAQHRKRVFLREKTFRGGGESHSCSRFWAEHAHEVLVLSEMPKCINRAGQIGKRDQTAIWMLHTSQKETYSSSFSSSS